MAEVLFLEDVCIRLRIGLTTARKLRRHHAFPIPELTSLDKRPRYSSADVDRYLERQDAIAVRRKRSA